jgi:hypothetical protein
MESRWEIKRHPRTKTDDDWPPALEAEEDVRVSTALEAEEDVRVSMALEAEEDVRVSTAAEAEEPAPALAALQL